jgi:hypothetical protein
VLECIGIFSCATGGRLDLVTSELVKHCAKDAGKKSSISVRQLLTGIFVNPPPNCDTREFGSLEAAEKAFSAFTFETDDGFASYLMAPEETKATWTFTKNLTGDLKVR